MLGKRRARSGLRHRGMDFERLYGECLQIAEHKVMGSTWNGMIWRKMSEDWGFGRGAQ